ncbi:L-seryl-tRNA(Sec) selenium transferase [Ornithinimicrobium sp. Y1847]|uniref:L-seryl-tRNA(Sec) selenium transferase n=1 Tax=unclassified Ornithinimicrobium TaxID=2615080 RepID=UPI003B6791E1
MTDPRRAIPRTDALLADPEVAVLVARVGRGRAKSVVVETQAAAREGRLSVERVQPVVVQRLAALAASATSLRPVINATGVVVHTNLGRAPLGPAAREAVFAAAGYVDVELDLADGQRARRGRGTLAALRQSVPEAEDALVVNNGAAALLLATTALGSGRELLVSRGEMVEIGDGFRLPDLIESAGARLREVGTTNRTTVEDYRAALSERTGALLKVHPSNFRVTGFTASATVGELAELGREHGIPLVVDTGSGLLAPDPALPDEPDAASVLHAGADLVTASGDKLLGGPQAGLVLGSAELVARLRRHPMARALRVDKLTLAALEATLLGPEPPVPAAVHASAQVLEKRTRALADRLAGAGVPVEVVPVAGRVGGGGAPEVPLPGWAVALPEGYAAPLRHGDPAVLARLESGRCLVDLRCVPQEQEEDLVEALLGVAAGGSGATGRGTG